LAGKLQRLIPALLFCWSAGLMGASAADAPSVSTFSHQVHLKLKLACATCHASALTSTKLSDNNLPDKKVCARCHADGRTPRTGPSPVWLTGFNHQQHLKLGNVAKVLAAAIDSGKHLSPDTSHRRFLDTNNACVACHRGLEEADVITKAHFPLMADCLVCHSKIEPPFSCETCHEPGPRLKPASHVPDFIDLHSAGKLKAEEKQSCAVCHGRNFRCMGCH
jgi:hypothetical protein